MPQKKQAERRAEKKATKESLDEAEEKPQSNGNIKERALGLLLDSVLAKTGPKMQELLTAPAEVKNGSVFTNDVAEETKEQSEQTEGETKEEEKSTTKSMAEDMFESLQTRLVWHNCLGLGSPGNGAAAMQAWKDMKALECDFGPRAKRKGTPGVDRILANFESMMPQYFHALLALMTLRAFLFRSYFACLPWLLVYQNLSLLVPLTKAALPEFMQQVPVELEKCPLKYRVAGTIGLNALVWFFFIYEFVLKSYFFEKIPYLGLLAYHAYAFRPAEK